MKILFAHLDHANFCREAPAVPSSSRCLVVIGMNGYTRPTGSLRASLPAAAGIEADRAP